SNPALNEKVFEDAAGWAAGVEQLEEAYAQPSYDPRARTDVMTVNGTVWATAALLVLLVAAGAYGWSSVDHTADTIRFPGWLTLVMLGGLGVAVLTVFKPTIARFTAPVYALLQ